MSEVTINIVMRGERRFLTVNRLYTMARFGEPEEVAPICECDYCGDELFEGDDVFIVYSDVFCSEECVVNAVASREVL